MDQLESLVQISRYYGQNPAYVLAGGGNSSFKDQEKLWIKASGIPLAGIRKEDFVVLSRERLAVLEERSYSEDPVTREAEVKHDLSNAVVGNRELRPSVETSLHNLIGHAFIVHTHPTLINALMCSQNAAQETEERFGDTALYMEYTDPGYTLFKKLQSRIREYTQQHGSPPKIIFLQNHGIFVGADRPEEIRNLYEDVGSAIRKGKQLDLPDSAFEPCDSDTVVHLSGLYREAGWMCRGYRSRLIDHFTSGVEVFRKVSRPFTPDIIVYCKSHYLVLEPDLSREDLEEKVAAFRKHHGYLPKVILEEAGGLFVAGASGKDLKTVLEVYNNMMQISYLSEQFGGPHAMTDQQIAFIDSWEVENYRRKVAGA